MKSVSISTLLEWFRSTDLHPVVAQSVWAELARRGWLPVIGAAA